MKRFAGYALLTLCVLPFAGCGGGSSGSGGTSSGTPATSAQTPAPYSAAGLTHLHRLSITETIKPAKWFIYANNLKKIGSAWHVGVTEIRMNTLYDTEMVNYGYGALANHAVAFNSLQSFSAYSSASGSPYIELNGATPFIFQSGTPPSGGTPQLWAYPADYGGQFARLAIGQARSGAIARSFGNKLVVMDYAYNQGGSGSAPYRNSLDYPANPTSATAFPQDSLIAGGDILLDAAHAFLDFDFDKFQDGSAFYAYLSRADKLAPDLGGQAAGHLHLLSYDGSVFTQLATPLSLSAVASASTTLWTPFAIHLVQDGSDATKPLIVLIDEVNQMATVARFDGTALSVVASGLALPTGFNASSPMAARNGVLYVAVGANLYRSNATTFERLNSSIFNASQIISIGTLSADANGVVVALSRNDAAYTLRYLIDVVQVP